MELQQSYEWYKNYPIISLRALSGDGCPKPVLSPGGLFLLLCKSQLGSVDFDLNYAIALQQQLFHLRSVFIILFPGGESNAW